MKNFNKKILVSIVAVVSMVATAVMPMFAADPEDVFVQRSDINDWLENEPYTYESTFVSIVGNNGETDASGRLVDQTHGVDLAGYPNETVWVNRPGTIRGFKNYVASLSQITSCKIYPHIGRAFIDRGLQDRYPVRVSKNKDKRVVKYVIPYSAGNPTP